MVARLDARLHACPRIARPLFRRLRLAAAAALLAGLGQAGLAQPAGAQAFFDDDILPPRAVAWRLADRGFTGIGRPRFDGRAYVVEAFGPGGARLRLVVDPEDGEILSRQRLDAPAMAARPAPAAPGYGWTEEDEIRPRGRVAERLVPPAEIPLPERGGVYPQPRGAVPAREAMREVAPAPEPGRREGATAAANPYGLNPEAGRTAPAPRKVARVAPAPELRPAEAKPALRDAPEAPRPAASTRPTAVPAKPAAAPKITPARTPPVEPGVDAAKAPETKPAETKAADLKPEAKPAAAPVTPEWKDPPEGRRNVRVIGGATVVPGTAEKDGAAAQ